jgi:hypothetical protein
MGTPPEAALRYPIGCCSRLPQKLQKSTLSIEPPLGHFRVRRNGFPSKLRTFDVRAVRRPPADCCLGLVTAMPLGRLGTTQARTTDKQTKQKRRVLNRTAFSACRLPRKECMRASCSSAPWRTPAAMNERGRRSREQHGCSTRSGPALDGPGRSPLSLARGIVTATSRRQARAPPGARARSGRTRPGAYGA